MVISGVVITLGTPEGSALEALANAGPFELGERQGNCLPAVLETRDSQGAEEWFEWAGRLPGVVKVDLAFVSVDDQADAEPPADK